MKKVLLIDNGKREYPHYDKVLLWNDFNENNNSNVNSLSLILEKNKFYYRKKYLKLASLYKHKFWDKSKFNRIYDKKLNIFYLTSLFNDSVFQKDCIHLKIIKLIIFIDFLKKNKIEEVHVNLSDYKISKFFKIYCYKKKINYKNLRKNNTSSYFSYKKLISKIKYLYKFLLLIIKIKVKNDKNLVVSDNETIMIDIFTHFSKKDALEGNFKSNYWNSLYDDLIEKKTKVKFVHLFFRHKNTKNLNSANNLIFNLNKKTTQDLHMILENFFSFKNILPFLFSYTKNFFMYLKHSNCLQIKKNSCLYGLNFILNPKIADSIIGFTAVRNLLYYKYFSNLFNKIKNPKIGIYLMENHDFEIILNYLWKKNFKDKKLVGFPHSAIRFWDLKYFFLKPSHGYDYFPENVCVHSKDTEEWARFMKLNNNKIVFVESLRHERLQYIKKIQYQNKNKKYLVFGDIDYDLTFNLLGLLIQKKDINFYIKLHPATPFKKNKFYPPNIKFIDEVSSLTNFDCVIISNSSTTVFEPYYANFPFLVYLNTNFFNLCPLLNLGENNYFYDLKSLEKCLDYLSIKKHSNQNLHIFNKKNKFWLDLIELNKLNHRFKLD